MEASIVGTAAARMPGLDRPERATAASADELEAAGGQGGRLMLSLNPSWRFKHQGTPGAGVEPEFLGAAQPGYNDSSWETVVVPHTWDATADNPFCVTNHFRGLAWYRREVEIPDPWRGRRVWIEFKAVFQVADVYVNGQHVGQHVGGFTGFGFDITDHLKFDASNLIAVHVNDVLVPTIAPANETNVPGYGGIYRSVSLVAMDLLHVERNGTWVTTEQAGNEVNVRVRTWIQNQSGEQRDFRLESLIQDAQGQTAGKLEASGSLGPNETKEIDQKTGVANPHLWSPDDPHLYQLVSVVSDGNRTTDRYLTPFGIRFMGHDPATGFTLNGKPINLHGVNRRQDYGFLGDAVPEAVGVKDVRIMKDMGVNFMRTSHYPQDPAIIAACDQLGILVWEEVPNIKIYLYPPPQEGDRAVYTTRFPRALMRNIKHQLQEMVERDRNHPSIIIWGFADDLEGYQFPEDFAELSDYTHTLDPARWTAGRCPPVTDIIHASPYFEATTPESLVQAHREHPEKMYIRNEWGALMCERGREEPALVRDRDEDVTFPDSEAALACEGHLMQWNAVPWLGTAKWCMFDTGVPNEAWNRGIGEPRDGKVTNRWPFLDYFGVADMWRIPKEAYYLFQSEWTEEPMVHIVGHWTWPQDSGNRQVRIYSNCHTVELFLNGRSLGAHPPATQERIWQDARNLVEKYHDLPPPLLDGQFMRERLPGAMLRHPPFVWDDVGYKPGTLLAVGRKGSVTVRGQIRSAGPAKGIVLTTDKPSLRADGVDVSFIQAAIVDAAGTTVPTAQSWITFSAEGPGRLLGGATEIDAITGIAAINVQNTGQPGEIVVKAESPGLAASLLRIRVSKATKG
jgi:beta-galactosidase